MANGLLDKVTNDINRNMQQMMESVHSQLNSMHKRETLIPHVIRQEPMYATEIEQKMMGSSDTLLMQLDLGSNITIPKQMDYNITVSEVNVSQTEGFEHDHNPVGDTRVTTYASCLYQENHNQAGYPPLVPRSPPSPGSTPYKSQMTLHGQSSLHSGNTGSRRGQTKKEPANSKI